MPNNGDIGIYRLYCKLDRKSYVGQSIRLSKRIKNHLQRLNRGVHYCAHLQRAWNKYGAEAFTIEIVKTCSEDDLTYWEQHYMDLIGRDNLFNTCPAAGSSAGTKRSEETKEKMSAVKRGHKHSEETKRKIASAKTGQKTSEKTKKKLASAGRKRKLSEKTKEKISAALLGRNK